MLEAFMQPSNFTQGKCLMSNVLYPKLKRSILDTTSFLQPFYRTSYPIIDGVQLMITQTLHPRDI